MADPKHRPWTPDEIQRAVDLRTSGLKFAAIAEMMGRSKSSVQDKVLRGAAARSVKRGATSAHEGAAAVVLARQIAAHVAPRVAEPRTGGEGMPVGHEISWGCVCDVPEWWHVRG